LLGNPLASWLRAFQPDADLRALVLNKITEQARQEGSGPNRKAELTDQLRRLQELFVLGDLTKAQYIMRRQAVQDELECLAPPADPQLTEAENVLADFASFWDREKSLAERHRLLATLFEQVWQDDGKVVAIKPQPPFAAYFQAICKSPEKPIGTDRCQERERRGFVPPFTPRTSARSRSGQSRHTVVQRPGGSRTVSIRSRIGRLSPWRLRCEACTNTL
jgi:hypothetical protein